MKKTALSALLLLNLAIAAVPAHSLGLTTPSDSKTLNHHFYKEAMVFSTSGRLAVFICSISEKNPLIEIYPLPIPEVNDSSSGSDAAFGAGASVRRGRSRRNPDLRRLPYVFRIDTNMDGKPEVEIRPGANSDNMLVHELANVGCQFNSLWSPSNPELMPLFDRAEFQLHDTFRPEAVINRLKFRINRIILRRRADGNFVLSLKDKFFNTGGDILLKSNFKW